MSFQCPGWSSWKVRSCDALFCYCLHSWRRAFTSSGAVTCVHIVALQSGHCVLCLVVLLALTIFLWFVILNNFILYIYIYKRNLHCITFILLIHKQFINCLGEFLCCLVSVPSSDNIIFPNLLITKLLFWKLYADLLDRLFRLLTNLPFNNMLYIRKNCIYLYKCHILSRSNILK